MNKDPQKVTHAKIHDALGYIDATESDERDGCDDGKNLEYCIRNLAWIRSP